MQAFKFFIAALAFVSAGALAQHAAHGRKAELGTSAAVDNHGQLWIVHKEGDAGGQNIVLRVSADGGQTWDAPRRVLTAPEPVSAEGENRPKIAFGRRNEIYITWTRPLSRPYTGEIRFVRSLDGGRSFSAPRTVHANRDIITHRFESMIVDRDGRIYVTWIDKRDLHAAQAKKRKYAGAAVYYAVSDDGGASFRGDHKIADHSCECCRIALALDQEGQPVALWRHVFEPNVRDHALARLAPDGRVAPIRRASFDDWRVDACPHHGPGLAFAPDGTRHQVWFNVREGEGGVFYSATSATGEVLQSQRLGNSRAAHADVAVHGQQVAVAWKQFDGKETAVLARLSEDGGRTWRDLELARTQGPSDQPRLVTAGSGVLMVWRTRDEDVVTVAVRGRQ